MRKGRYGLTHRHKLWPHRKAWCMFAGFVLVVIITVISIIMYATSSEMYFDLELGTPEFLVYSDQCKIPNVLPWNSEFQKFFYHPTQPYKCSKKELLTGIAYEEDKAFLYVNESLVSSYSAGVVCCYKTVSRANDSDADIKIQYSACHQFESRVLLEVTEVVVTCTDKYKDVQVYSNAHSIIFKSETIKRKIAAFKDKEKPPSIILFGLDSMSRLNFHRMLPLTKKYLDAAGWVEFKGYNKVGMNTFPNLMALLTGRNISRAYEACNPSKTGSLDLCNFIWKNYSDSNYVTAYIEDAISISTFTYWKKGFLHPPVDLYYRPYLIAAEDLGTKLVDDMYFCDGPVSAGERILQVLNEFMIQVGDQPKFGLFWSNTFSHDNVNAPAKMDQILANFFKDVQTHLNNTIVLFFSDHGMRFGNMRLTKTGWYEERLPFAYFWFPQSFKHKFPIEYDLFVGNSMKLTTPYDVYITLQHLLILYNNNNYNHLYCDASANCKSLLENVGDRSCEYVNIPISYCSCFGYKSFDIKSELVERAGEFGLQELNKMLKHDGNASLKCVQFKVDRVTLAQIAVYKNVSYLLYQLQTLPRAVFEFTVSFDSNYGNYFKLEDGISRLDRYELTSQCVNKNQQYCYCQSYVFMRMNYFSFWFEV